MSGDDEQQVEPESELVDLAELPEEERKQIMARAREFVRTKNIARAQKKSNESRKRKGGKMHKPGSHWYELEAYFDPKLIESTPIQDSGFMMGVLEDMLVVEVKSDTPVQVIKRIGDQLVEMGLKSLIVRDGIRFLRLKSCDVAQEKQLNDILAKQTEKEAHDEDGANGASGGGDDTSG